MPENKIEIVLGNKFLEPESEELIAEDLEDIKVIFSITAREEAYLRLNRC